MTAVIVNKCLNGIISFFDKILPTFDLSGINQYKEKFVDLAGYGSFFFGSGFLKLTFGLIAGFVSAKLLVGIVQWIWEKLPTN